MLTSSGARTAAAGSEAAQERLRSAESWEAAAENLGPAAGWGGAAENLGPTGGLETAAAYEVDLTTAGEAAARQGSGSSAAVATAGSGAAAASAATSDAAAVVATALDAAATSDAGSIAFERIAPASASSFWMKRAPSTSTALTGLVRPWSMMRLAFGWTHTSVKVRSLVCWLFILSTVACGQKWASGGVRVGPPDLLEGGSDGALGQGRVTVRRV